MKKVIVASKNPVKITCTKTGFSKALENQAFEFEGVSVPSDVSDQPMSDEETLQGAINRAKNARTAMSEAHFWVGIEGGVDFLNDELQAFAWVVIISEDRMGKSRTSTFFLPEEISHLVKDGIELGVADDMVFKRENSKQKNGAVGILTKDLIDRATYYEQAVILALVPFMNEDLY
ncbi:MAG: inosine/xanthosine triphosphatase [Bacteroidota bacterium]